MNQAAKSLGEFRKMVDLPVEPRAVTPKTASIRLAILLFCGLLVFVGVVIITMTISKGVGEPLGIECRNVIVGYAPGMRMLMGVGGPRPIHKTKYEIVVRDFHIPLPAALGEILVGSSRCG
jgi:hypothetical protein